MRSGRGSPLREPHDARRHLDFLHCRSRHRSAPPLSRDDSRSGLLREETGSSWASSKASMKARIRSAVTSLGERPRRSSRIRFGSPVVRKPNVDGFTPVRSRNPANRDSNSFVSVSMPVTLNEFWQQSQNLGNRTISLSDLMPKSYEDRLSGGSGRGASSGPRSRARGCGRDSIAIG